MKKSSKQLSKKKQLETDFLLSAPERCIEHFWPKVILKSTGDRNCDYGEHYCTLNFPHNASKRKPLDEVGGIRTYSDIRIKGYRQGEDLLPNGQPTVHDGNGSFGLVKDKENFPLRALHPPVDLKPGQKSFLEDFRIVIYNEKSNIMTQENSKCMRMIVLKGAETLAHTDAFRSSLLPNFFLFFAPRNDSNWNKNDLNFSLTVRMWPMFKTSFVKYDGEILIPFDFKDCPTGHDKFEYSSERECGGYMKFIKLCPEKNVAKWLVCPPAIIHLLEPYKKLPKSLAVAGIADGMLKVVNDDYKVITSWADVQSMSWEDLIMLTVPDSKPKKMLRNMEKPLKIYSFNGWQFVHWVDEICKDCIDAIRLHVFFRNIRPINVCAQAAIKRVKDGTIQIISHHDLDGKAAFRTLRKQI